MLSLKYLQDFSLDKVYNRSMRRNYRSVGSGSKLNYSVSEAIDVCQDLISEVRDGNERTQNILAFHPKFNLGEPLSADEVTDLQEFINSFEPITLNLPNGQVISFNTYNENGKIGFKTNGSVLFAYDVNDGSVVSDGSGLIKSESGLYIPINDICNAMSQSIQEAEVLSHAIDMSTTNQASSASFLASLSMYKGQFSAKTMELVQQLAAVLNYNDPRGLLQLISNYFSMFSGATDNSDNTMSLSSISWKVETGLVVSISGLITTVGQFVSTIVSFFSVAVGFTISTIGNIVSGIINADKSDATYPEFNTMASSPTLAVPVFQNRRPVSSGLGSKVKELGYVRYHNLGLVCHAWIDPLDDNYWYSEGFLDLRYNIIPNSADGCCGARIDVTSSNTTVFIPAHRWVENGVDFSGGYSYPSGYYDGKTIPYNKDITNRVLSALLFTMFGLLDPFIAYTFTDDNTVEVPINDIILEFSTYSTDPTNVEQWIRSISYFITRLNVGDEQIIIDEVWPKLVNNWIPLIREGYNVIKASGFGSVNTSNGMVYYDEFNSNIIGYRSLSLSEYPVTKPQGSFTHFVKPAVQSADSWISSTILSSAVVVATAAAAAFTVFKVRRAVTSFLNKKSLAVKNAEYNYAQNPTAANANAYTKALRKQAAWQSMLGRANPAIMNSDNTSGALGVKDTNLTSSVDTIKDNSESIIRLIKP